jgi:hypothetical protein
MRFAYAYFAQAAEISGKRVHVFAGDFSTIIVPTVPASASFCIVVKFACDPPDFGREHLFGIVLSKPDDPVPQIVANETITAEGDPEHPDRPAGILMVVACGATFQITGEYRIGLTIDAVEIHSLPLYVELQQPKESAAAHDGTEA